MKLSKAIEGFFVHLLSEGYSEHTVSGYKWAYDLMIAHLGDPEIEAVTPTEVEAFLSWLRTGYIPHRRNGDTSPLSNVSLSKAWAAIRSLYNWASKELRLRARPDLGISRPRGVSKVITPFTEEELRALLRAAANTKVADTVRRATFSMQRPTAARDTAIVLTLLDTGLRVSELARLKVGDVSLETGEIQVRPVGSGVKSKARHVYLGKKARSVLWKYMADREDIAKDDYVFLTIDGTPMDRNSIRLFLVRMGQRAGVSKVHPHKFRHTMAIQYLRNGGDVFTLQRLLGHETLEMVKVYVALADADSDNAHRKASPVDRWRL